MSRRHQVHACAAAARASGPGAVALHRTIVHRFDRGEPDVVAGHYPPVVRLLLLFGGAGTLWWSLYVLVRVTLG